MGGAEALSRAQFYQPSDAKRNCTGTQTEFGAKHVAQFHSFKTVPNFTSTRYSQEEIMSNSYARRSMPHAINISVNLVAQKVLTTW